jgi:predicted transcriptional regulator
VTRRPDGAFETDVLRVLWSADEPLSPGEINDRLDAGYAYTSVATILTRLQAKGLVVRRPAGRSYVYEAAIDEADLAVRRISELLDSSSDRASVLSRFFGELSPREVDAVRATLDRALRDRER